MDSLDRGLAAIGRGWRIQIEQAGVDDRLVDISLKLVALCLLYTFGAALIWPTAFGEVLYIYLAKLIAIGPMTLLLALVSSAVFTAPKAPISFVIQLLRARGRQAAVIVAIFVLLLAAFTTYKVNIPKIVPFYCDNALADLGELLHGQAPWKIAHAFDSDGLAWLVDVAYSRIWFLEWFGMAMYAALYANRAPHLRYLAALVLTTVVVGTMLATLLSSAGPLFYDQLYSGTRYEGLLRALRQFPSNEQVLHYSDYLMRNYRTGTAAFGTGISAMPSMHVAIATLNALYLARLNRWFGVAGWVFAMFILFGSVYTGWHYSVDGYVAILVVAVIWQRTRPIDNTLGASKALAETLYPAPAARPIQYS
ncbi:hypothetical protein FJ987_27815 [Mesorhizobium sp. CU2]|uniref:phosphatase PAP2 family protein n=1 Tax=unclassified Mesorhizobium TaxID=325217 RepID=UPI0011298640|nr:MULTISPECIES: phosphatase PAP2 family protein [unclassified Mesorhizobium]TPN84347.1 hypothetical protein FJ988_12135 [Mesorhizobium sp. CU3]TPO03466.1 hypothetical protein FJ987_27815 [Mesorhizobium sp. CU2]